MDEIKCLACDKTLKLPQFVNTDNFDGEVVCQECKSRLHLKLVKEKVLKYKLVEKQVKSAPIVRFTIGKGYDKQGNIEQE